MKKPERPPNNMHSTEEALGLIFDLNKDAEKRFLIVDDSDYPYWDKFKYKVKDVGYRPEILWTIVKFRRAQTMQKIKPSAIEGFEFKYNNAVNRILESLHRFDLNMGGIMEGGAIITDNDKDRFLVSSLMEEAIASSQLEGAVTTREEAKKMLLEDRKPKNHSEKMIVNNYLTIKEISKYKNEKLSPQLIKDIHAIITRDTLANKENEGRYRENDSVNVVDGLTGEVYYTPPSHVHLTQLMIDFCEFANTKEEKPFIHPIVKAIILHFLIGYIHPFVDGNGRTARAIFYWYLLSKGYWLIEYMSISRIIVKSPEQYARAYLYSEYDENDLTYFIDFNIKSMDLALKSLKEYIAKKISEKKQLTQMLLKDNFNERQAEVIKDFIDSKDAIITIHELQHKFGIVYQTARTDLLKLVEMGYLGTKAVGKKHIFFKSETFDTKIKMLQ